ncbi:spermidine synthase [Solirubrobacter deserti]|uniref:spermidine synthase n=1 Tax=Solirubrobacter deserti TaxID=2282478 RepID=UPI0022CD9CEC|nr:fused MFS/spermidine synthase [Solirubrobacter deserti]
MTGDRRVVALFSATMLTSAILLFAVQPMVARFVLPTFGSAPQVWAVALVFFQAVLLLGYLYAHVSSSRLGVRRALTLHGVLLVLPVLVLPLGVPATDAGTSAGNPAWALLGLLTVSVGLPFFVVSTTAPLLQRWLVNTDHPAGRDPYFLYRASNFGSVLGLVSYPLLFEPRLALDDQGRWWTWGYVLLAVLLFACAAFVWRNAGAARPVERGADEQLTVRRRLTWLVLAAVPSGLVVAATTVLTTDVAPIPLLWVLPLGLYLITFMIAFSSGGRSRWVFRASVWLMPLAILAVAVVTVAEIRSPLWLILTVHLVAVFLVAMVCHGRLAQDRPAPQKLTTFYLVESAGGVLGGAFAALLAPLVFNALWEYPLFLVGAALLWPGVRGVKPRRVWDLAWPVGLGVAVYVALTELSYENAVLIAGAAVCVLFALRRPARLAAGLAALFLAGTWGVAAAGTPVIERERNFFGVRTVEQGSGVRSLVHGTTLHGNQLLRTGLPQPTTYYHPASPIGQLVTGGPRGITRRTAVVGLGTGTMAAYSQPGDEWTFYEIDPEIVRVARNPRYFTYLRDAPGATEVVIGDARLSLEEARDRTFSLIVADAFSSDAIPTHLITREAIDLYFRKLVDDGVLAFHISNRYIDLESVLGNLAREARLACYAGDLDAPLGEGIEEANASAWVALARRPEDLGDIAGDGRWQRCETGPDSHTWTDDYSNIISLLR